MRLAIALTAFNCLISGTTLVVVIVALKKGKDEVDGIKQQLQVKRQVVKKALEALDF